MLMILWKRLHLPQVGALILSITFTFWTETMITSKAQMIRIMKKCDGADTLTREQKFQVFVNVCDNMLKEGRMTKATHKRFTHIF